MSAKLLSGIVAREFRTPILTKLVKSLGYTPKLAIIQVGDRLDSTAYVNAKKSFAAIIGVEVVHQHFPFDINQDEVLGSIRRFNADSSVQGIIIQLPLPEHLDKDALIEAIDPHKDVDGLTTANYQKIILGQSGVVPATARGVFELLSYYSIDLKDKCVVVVGRSRLVGTPVAILAKRAGADIIVCHSKTIDLAEHTRKADVLVVAVGKAGLIGADHVKSGAVVVDIGVTKTLDGSLRGDVDHATVDLIASMITPVPGGVGPMTVLGLFENVLDACTTDDSLASTGDKAI